MKFLPFSRFGPDSHFLETAVKTLSDLAKSSIKTLNEPAHIQTGIFDPARIRVGGMVFIRDS